MILILFSDFSKLISIMFKSLCTPNFFIQVRGYLGIFKGIQWSIRLVRFAFKKSFSWAFSSRARIALYQNIKSSDSGESIFWCIAITDKHYNQMKPIFGKLFKYRFIWWDSLLTRDQLMNFINQNHQRIKYGKDLIDTL